MNTNNDDLRVCHRCDREHNPAYSCRMCGEDECGAYVTVDHDRRVLFGCEHHVVGTIDEDRPWWYRSLPGFKPFN